MSGIDIIGPEAESVLDWIALTDAMAAAHAMPRAELGDTFLYRGGDTLLTRSAWIDGLGIAVKPCTIYPGNTAKGVESINGTVNLFDDATGRPEALIDFHLVTKWKTAGDSLLAARRLARPDARAILILGAGTVARSMTEAYRAAFPEARFTIWNRSAGPARALAEETGATVAGDLAAAVAGADIIATATMSSAPLVEGRWLRPGTHLDLIGAYRPDMRECDDEVMRRASVFVNNRATALDIGEIADPIAAGVIAAEDIRADYYDLPAGLFRRESDDEITLCKNGGGAHLDLITARYILDAWRAR